MPTKRSSSTRHTRNRIEEMVVRHARIGVLRTSNDRPIRLDPSLRREMELMLQTRLPELRIHVGERAWEMAEILGARAFAVGERDVFFGKGEFKPYSPEGKGLLAHELFHLAEGSAGLRSRHGQPNEHDEIEAREFEEMVFAQERENKAWHPQESLEPQTVKLDTPRSHNEHKEAEASVTIDKSALEEKVMQVIEKQLQRGRERRGER